MCVCDVCYQVGIVSNQKPKHVGVGVRMLHQACRPYFFVPSFVPLRCHVALVSRATQLRGPAHACSVVLDLVPRLLSSHWWAWAALDETSSNTLLGGGKLQAMGLVAARSSSTICLSRASSRPPAALG